MCLACVTTKQVLQVLLPFSEARAAAVMGYCLMSAAAEPQGLPMYSLQGAGATFQLPTLVAHQVAAALAAAATLCAWHLSLLPWL